MVRPSLEFIALTFALFKAGAVIVLIDPGMGRTNIFKCLEEVDPDGFVAIPVVHWIRMLSGRFPRAKRNVIVGRGWAPNCDVTYSDLLGVDVYGRKHHQYDMVMHDHGKTDFANAHALDLEYPIVRTQSNDSAAVIFTSGSTGPPKGVLYEHGMFNAQVDLLQQFYGIEPGEVDLPGFPLFGLFNAAMGVTTVIPDMDPTKPAQVNPLKIIEAIRDNGVTQAFGSPALWNRVGTYCVENGVKLPSLRRALSAGGPVPIRVLEMMTQVLDGATLFERGSAPLGHAEQPVLHAIDGFQFLAVPNPSGESLMPRADLHTPYGATESLPVASISAREVLARTAAKTRQGAGTCVGRAFPGVDIRIIPVTDGPIANIEQTRVLPVGEIGEIIVRSPSVTREYFRRPEPTAAAKIPDGETFWHRIGDVGYLDEEGLLWFCGRKAHIVHTAAGPLYSVCCEGILDSHPQVFRSALVGVGPRGQQKPVAVIERFPIKGPPPAAIRADLQSLAKSFPLTAGIDTFEFIDAMPVDTRHNVKINREALSEWAAKKLSR